MSNTDLHGWSRGTWNSGAWNKSIPLEVSGVQAATATGSASISVAITFAVSGVQAATATGTGTVQINFTFAATGVEASTAVGNPLIWQEIVPGQSSGFGTAMDTSQTPDWIQIAA